MDFLSVDPKIHGQNYCCMSFVSPTEDTLEKKELFYFEKFLKSAQEKYKINFEELRADYQDFKVIHNDKLQEDFNKIVGNKTNIRGIKVRGVYDSVEEAKYRAKKLRETDENFSVFVGQVGYWLPFDPTPELIQDQEYIETELNNLVQKHQESRQMAKRAFEERKQQIINEAVASGRKITESEVEEQLNKEFNVTEITPESVKKQLEEPELKLTLDN